MSNNVEARAALVRKDYTDAADSVYACLRCHPGAVRPENQDRVAHISVPAGELFLVLDGVGGQRGGAEAATIGLEEYGRAMSGTASGADALTALQQATESVNARIANARQSGGAEMQGMASTVALALLQEDVACIGHIGDSRVYLFRNGSLGQLTRDHSVSMAMVEHGILSEEEAKDHASSHILTRSLGQPDAALDTTVQLLMPGDLLLLCSDGLWAYVDEAAVKNTLFGKGGDLPAAADELLQLALNAGAPDNVSLVLIRYPLKACASKALAAPSEKRRTSVVLGFKFGVLLLVLGVLVFLLLGGYFPRRHVAPIKQERPTEGRSPALDDIPRSTNHQHVQK